MTERLQVLLSADLSDSAEAVKHALVALAQFSANTPESTYQTLLRAFISRLRCVCVRRGTQ